MIPKEQEVVRIRLEEKFPNAFKIVKIFMHKIKRSYRETNIEDKISTLLSKFRHP
jgi:hypothetical protein